MDRTGETATPPLLTEPGRSSPPPSCSICLGQFRNTSYTENCLHQFCFDCLLTWSKIKAECPLCKQPFKSIIHNVRSNDLYDKYEVQSNAVPDPLGTMPSIAEIAEIADSWNELEAMYSRRYRYSTTLTLHPRENLAIQRLLLSFPGDAPLNLSSLERIDGYPITPQYQPRNRFNMFRRTIYRQNLWVLPLSDITGRFRDCMPEFYRNNPAQVNRLVPWLTRELSVLLPDPTQTAYIIAQITESITLYEITSRRFRDMIVTFFPDEAEHFIHEFYSFARSPYDMVGYDHAISYQSGNLESEYNSVNEISSSSPESADSDVYLISEPGPSSSLPPQNSRNLLSQSTNNGLSNSRRNTYRSFTPPLPSTNAQANLNSLSNPVVIETISQSDTDDSQDEVVMVRYIKPPQDRTPEVVDLLASDSDAIIIEDQPSENVIDSQPTLGSPLPDPSMPSTSGLVKLSLKRNLSPTISLSDTDSDKEVTSLTYESNMMTMLNSNRRNPDKWLGYNSDDSDTTSTTSSQVSNSSTTQSSKSHESRPKTSRPAKKQSTNFKDREQATKAFCRSISHSSQNASKKLKTSKKSKSKRHAKKSSDHHTKKKHKHKSKLKKRPKSRDKYLFSDFPKNSSKLMNRYNKSRNKNNNDLYLHANNQPLGYWPRTEVENSASSTIVSTTPQENKCERKTLKSVVNSIGIQKLSASFNSNTQEPSSSTYNNVDKVTPMDENSNEFARGSQAYLDIKPLDLRMKEESEDMSS